MRINKYIASCGICSRRAAEELIESKRIRIDGKIAVLQDRVGENSVVELDSKPINPVKNTVTLAYNKPIGVECTSDKSVPNNIIATLNYPTRLFTVGRLDKDSEGLILLTNDGDLCYRLSKASEKHEKEYEVSLNKPIAAGFVSAMENGVEILDTITAPCKVKKLSNKKFRIILVQGLNRQIRRMCEQLGYKVTSLKRLRIDRLELGSLKVGRYKKLSPDDAKRLFD